jgi:hypothetical protein
MQKATLNISMLLGAIAVAGVAFSGGVYFCLNGERSNPQPPAPVVTTDEGTKLYSTNQLHFSIRYPAYLDDIQEEEGRVVFRMKNDPGLSGFGVTTEKVPFNTTQDWLNAQPKGSASSAGYEAQLLLGGESDTALVSEYVVVDSDMGKPIYGKIIEGLHVENGTLYKILFRNQFHIDQIPRISAKMMDVISSFRVLP